MEERNIDRETYERLCAYVLGELEADERAAFEAELERSEELRAEKRVVEATVGLVRTSLSEGGSAAGGEGLSDARREALRAAAGDTARPPLSLWRRPGVRLAASALLLGGLAGAYVLTREPGAVGWFGAPESERVARLSDEELAAEVELNERSRESAEAESLRGLAYLGYTDADAAGTPESAAAGEPKAGPTPPARAQESTTREITTSGGSSAAPSTSSAASEMTSETYNDVVGIGGGAGGGSFVGRYGGRAVRKQGGPSGGPSGSSSGGPATVAPGAELARGAAGGAPRRPAPRHAPGPGARRSRGRGPGLPMSRDGESWFAGFGGSPASGDRRAARDEVGLPEELRELYVRGLVSAEDLAAADRDGRERLEELGEEAGRPFDREALAERLLERCRRRPNESPRAMFFRFWGDNAPVRAALDPLSTFAADVDTASYTLARRTLADGHVPRKEQVRTEEFVNYFDAGVPAPLEDTFGIHLELAPSRYSADRERWMLRAVVAGREVQDFERDPLALTFVVDVSGSMERENRLELVKTSLRLLLTKLDANDAVALVAFDDEARLVLPMTSAANRATIEMALAQLEPDGSTNAEAGLTLGYAHAADHVGPGATHRVVFLSDGVANVGETDQDRITEEVRRFRERGIYLNTIGVGLSNHDDEFLEQLADRGDGLCDYVDTPMEARKALVENFTGAFQPIARDVKIQVEFDPGQVVRYRLLGYENRAVADRDFRNDAVDAGEIGAGHEVVALYELELGDTRAADGPLATLRLRWKPPHGDEASGVREIEAGIGVERAAGSFEGTSAGYRLSVVAAQFAELLRRSVHARDDSLDALIEDARSLESELAATGRPDADLAELVVLLERSRERILAALPERDPLLRAVDAYRRNQVLRAELDELRTEAGEEVVRRLEEQNRALEEEIRRLLEER